MVSEHQGFCKNSYLSKLDQSNIAHLNQRIQITLVGVKTQTTNESRSPKSLPPRFSQMRGVELLNGAHLWRIWATKKKTSFPCIGCFQFYYSNRSWLTIRLKSDWCVWLTMHNIEVITFLNICSILWWYGLLFG